LGAVKRGEIAVLPARHLGCERVPVVKVAASRWFHPELLAVARAKALGITARADVRIPPHHAHFLVIPAQGIDLGPETAVEVRVIHEQALHPGVVQLALQRGAVADEGEAADFHGADSTIRPWP